MNREKEGVETESTAGEECFSKGGKKEGRDGGGSVEILAYFSKQEPRTHLPTTTTCLYIQSGSAFRL